MKKLVYILLIVPLLFMACSKDEDIEDASFNFESFEEFLYYWNLMPYQNVCPSVTGAVVPESVDRNVLENFVIPEETIRSMTTCGLLETLLEYPFNRLGPWSYLISNTDYP